MPLQNTISPYEEMLSYEALWAMEGATYKTIADKFRDFGGIPSRVFKKHAGIFAGELVNEVKAFVEDKKGFSVSVHGAFQYPKGLRDARHPIELFYYKGDITLLDDGVKRVSVVGARNCSEKGKQDAARIAALLAENKCVVVSGLAKGRDTAAMTRIKNTPDAHMIGVLGTPIDEYYPPENKELQDFVASKHLLISQVPFFQYHRVAFRNRRINFPERNKTMAAISDATVIVEASDRSGTLSQAKACIEQGRKLFILRACVEDPNIKWPKQYIEKGAIVVRKPSDLVDNL